MAKNDVRIQVMVSKELFEDLRQMAWEDRRTLSEYLRLHLQDMVEQSKAK